MNTPASHPPQSPDVTVALDGFIATVEIHRPPNNFFDTDLIVRLATAFEWLDGQDCRAIVMCSEGKHFCAGANFAPAAPAAESQPSTDGYALYVHAARLFATSVPIVAAVQGAAIGGGLGLACAADFRVATSTSRFAANFSRLGFHHGFGLTVTLPRLVGQQRALEMLYTGRPVAGADALAIGLCDRLVEPDMLRAKAFALASEIAAAAPLAVRSIRATMLAGLHDAFVAATEREIAEQQRLQLTDDWREGITASAERRDPMFTGT
jgi:2-(1,2-epoxy-1,2-dihydrophenyl)acetyl-CoA isomerase